jgi:hypothetical protein
MASDKTDILFQQHENERLYPIGYEYNTGVKRANSKVKNTIIDYAITHNINGEITKFEYVISYNFCGQTITAKAAQMTIDIATNNGWKEL